MSENKCCKKTSIGGQAVLEGIMMRGPHKNALAVRLEDGTIDIDTIEHKNARSIFKPFGWPFIRGISGMIESFVIGYKALMMSADKLGIDDAEEAEREAKIREKEIKKAEKKGLPIPDFDSEEYKEKHNSDKKNQAILTSVMSIGTVLGVALALFLFLWVPIKLFNLLNNVVFSQVNLTPYKGLFEGVIKIIVFLVYIYCVSLMKDIKRTFQYHGAEHKTIFCYEHGEELTPENCRKFKRFHPRCGTAFLVLILVISILISTLVLFIWPQLTKITWLWLIIKLLLVPVICSLGYELIKICGKHDNIITKIISAPGMWVQRLTTKEPDDSMLEVAIAALKEVIPENLEEDSI